MKKLTHIGLTLTLFIIAIVIDKIWRVPDNPITLSLLLLFWISILTLVVPRFFKKYRYIIISVYGFILFYFLIVRIGWVDQYFELHKPILTNATLIPIPFILIIYWIDEWRAIKLLKAEKQLAELQLLKQQIDPHFFFNTLNNLYGLTVENNPKAPEVILQLSELMRYTIYKGKKQKVKLSEEITYLKNYIKIFQLRFYKTVHINFEHNYETDLYIAPLLMIVPLENAFKHGVEKLASNAFINITLVQSQKKLLYIVENNFELEPSNKAGIGLLNLKKRLELLYPNQHFLDHHSENGIFKITLEINNL